MDNYAAHKRIEVRHWLAANPRVQVHFTPTSGSWLNLVEVWFGIIERQAIRRGTFRSVKELNAKIRTFIDNWNDDRAHPFVWTKTADESSRTPTVQQLQTQVTSDPNSDQRCWSPRCQQARARKRRRHACEDYAYDPPPAANRGRPSASYSAL
jgi:DDE superfamily endonuclease